MTYNTLPPGGEGSLWKDLPERAGLYLIRPDAAVAPSP
jgi:hypothetical protein